MQTIYTNQTHSEAKFINFPKYAEEMPFNTFCFESALNPKEEQAQEKAEISQDDLTLNTKIIQDIVGIPQENEEFLQTLKFLANSKGEGLETKEIKKLEGELNPFSYPRTLRVLEDLMHEKINALYAQSQNSEDSTLQTLLLFKEQFLEFPNVMKSLKDEATRAAEMLALLSPKSLEEDKGGIYFQRAEELQKSIAAFADGANSGIAWIKGFFGTIAETLSPFEKELVSKHIQIFQAYWSEQTDTKKGITLNNGMVYEEYSDSNGINGFNLIVDNRILAYRTEALKDGSVQAVLAIFDKMAKQDDVVSLVGISGEMVASFEEIEKQGYQAIGLKTKFL
ncbi:hypothetical protein LS70_004725 [Helicobacter sp. MIT 11-5569]|uniref:hypothetical protein n=1 Tax=Helicobacter sp. MIT 11-5569 TaxID=1548151 RepID=UPI00051FEAA0|nr:hypothetical protein [Helicobacter sp. MIT 11-5569]TLD83471.1 hypothetical protein LS70_004725 [Helicobacter sp. MIT 11-5569]